MKDLRSQLSERFGASTPQEPAGPTLPAMLLDDAHLDSDWLAKLRFYRTLSGGPPVPDRPGLPAARQLTDKLVKALKKSGRTREAQELDALRTEWLARRDKQAWGEIKARFVEHGLSDKAYRGLKQGGGDPVRILTLLLAAAPEALKAMGAARLKEHLAP